jgi:peptide/nickel transport system substrate-binding protein
MRRAFRGTVVAVSATLALAVSGCSPASLDKGSEPGAGEGSAGASGGTMRVGVHGLPPGLGNPYTGVGSPGVFTWSAIFDSLTSLDAKGGVQPQLAESWKNTAPTRWECTLKKDISFSNGEPFDAAAVKATVDYLLGPEGSTTVVGGELNAMSGAEVLNSTTVAIDTTRPDPVLPAKLAAMSVVAPKAWADLGAKGFASAPVGTGSFTVDKIDENRVELSANKKSWRAPKVDAMSLIKLAEPASRVQALQSGQVDLAINLSPDQLPLVEQAGHKAHTSPAPQVMSLAFFQAGKGRITDVRIRKALNHAVNKQAMADSLLGGLAKPASQGVTPGTFGYNKDLRPFEYDPAKAKELLAEAGAGSGLKLVADVVVGTYAADAEIYQATAADLKKVGVDLELRQMPFSQWIELYQKNGWTGDVFGLSWNSAPASDAIRPYTIFSCAKKPAFFCDAKVTATLDKANNEFDPGAREKLLQQAGAAMQDDPPSLLLVEQVDINASLKTVGGYAADNRLIHYDRMTVK